MEEKIQKKSALDMIFSLGDKVTKGDVSRKADFDFYLLVIMFLAFLSVMIGNLIDFYKTNRLANLGWAFVMIAILWFQYFGLKQMYEFRKMIKSKPVQAEPLDNMIKGFK